MIVLCAGAYSSGSTWLFNVARRLLGSTRPDAASLYSSSAAHLLTELPPHCRDAVVKTHTIEPDLLALLRFADVRIIRSWRDPRDALASLMQRFGSWYHEAFGSLECSLVSLASIPPHACVLDFRYEEGFIGRIDTVARIAAFLDVEVDTGTCAEIVQALALENVRRAAAAIEHAEGPQVSPQYYDPATHWHPGHVREGKVGGWREMLDERLADAVTGAMLPLMGSPAVEPIEWADLLFYDPEGQRPNRNERIALPGADRFTIRGPELFLPAGRWQAALRVRAAEPDSATNMTLDVVANGAPPLVLALKLVSVTAGTQAVEITFDHANHTQPIELRLREIGQTSARRVLFDGATLTRTGDCALTRPSEARLLGRALAPAAPS